MHAVGDEVISLWNRRRSERHSARGCDTELHDRDRGSALPMVLVMTVIISMIVLPSMSYAVTVMRANTVLSQKSHRIESVKAGLRLALAQPSELYKACAEAGTTVAVPLANFSINDLDVSTKCYSLDVATTQKPDELRKGLVTTRIGSTIPAVLRSVGDDASVYTPTTSLTEWASKDPGGLASLASELDKIWLPNLPVHALSPRSPVGTQMSAGFADCTVYFPGTYADKVVLSGPTFFTSGIYYFEQDVVVRSGAIVVVGDGAIPGCTSSQEAVFYAQNVPSTHNLSGLGGTWVLGASARVLVDNAVGDVSLRFNARYASPGDSGDAPSQDVSIVSVNGDMLPDGIKGKDLNLEGSIFVPLSEVGTVGPADPVFATQQDYKPSVVTPKARAPEAPTGVTATPYRNAAKITWLAPGYDGGAQVTNYVVTASSGQTCSTNGALQCVVTGLSNSNTSFAATATNGLGASAPSTPTPNVMIGGSTLTAPAKPTDLIATPYAGGTMRVGWAAPASTTPVTGYVVTAAPGGQSCSVDMTTATAPATLACDITGMALVPPLPALGYTFTATATSAAGTTESNPSGLVVFPATGLVPATPLPGPVAYVPTVPAIIDIQLTGTGNAIVEIPGYVAVPQGRFDLNNPNGHSVRVAGGILASQIDVVDSRPGPPIGFIATIVQRKLKIVSTTNGGLEKSTAVVQINQNGAYAVNSWEVQ